jgi:hypothetical protein
MIRSFVAVSVCIALGTMLALTGLFGTIPRHVQSVSYSDAVDDNFGAAFDAVALTGKLDGPEFVITLKVRGEVSPDCSYSLIVVARLGSGSEDPHIYSFDLSASWKYSYYAPIYISDGDLVFRFPLHRLAEDAHIVGLEAYASGSVGTVYGTDLVNVGNRSEMQLSHVIDLGFEPLFMLVAGGFVLAAAAIAFVIRFGNATGLARKRP